MQTSEQATAGSLVWRLMLKWRAAVERALAPVGLTHAQYVLLASLRGLTWHGHRPSQRELADFAGLEPVFVSKLIRALERSGLVERATHPADPRAVQLRLTEHGVTVIDGAVTTVHRLQDELARPLGGVSGRRYRELTDMLRLLLGEQQPGEGDRNMTQATTALFGQDIGMASAAGRRLLTTVLDREAAAFPEWITLKLVNDEGVPVPRDDLVTRLANGVGLDPAAAGQVLAGLRSTGLLAESPAGVELTSDGQARFDRLFAQVLELSGEILAGLPAGDVAVARRVLADYTERANKLAAGPPLRNF
ncbi:MAG TPA: MarR family transcriptional regulator [Actinophytocola sp.]|uniref:MarR family transcriptional regulator n=1 Tax=Actinophytocola sp. TaxID=1872138 RepID=UPI002E00E3EB|nr:MarR family transcriptional regulator [Actinophytocola sp.]